MTNNNDNNNKERKKERKIGDDEKKQKIQFEKKLIKYLKYIYLSIYFFHCVHCTVFVFASNNKFASM